ncbi:MAG: DUF438 domain-containing protein [Selenomonadales bacterium]|nr:DUF438 domain-containing protein [Selenomonadales bacterium]
MTSRNFAEQKRVIREIIKDLHQGLSLAEAKQRMEDEVGTISSLEIAEVEQSLIDEGMSPDEIKRFCNVHALLFESALQVDLTNEENPAHPVSLLKRENREIEKLTAALRELRKQAEAGQVAGFVREARVLLKRAQDLDLHYTKKEQLLFPFLEKYGFMGPSKVMWGKHNEIRDLQKQATAALEDVDTTAEVDAFVAERLNPLIDEVDGMIFKEENILFPAALEKLKADDWIEILKESDQVGYAYIRPHAETTELIAALKKATADKPAIVDGQLRFPSGLISPTVLMHMLNALPVDLTFVDHEDTVRYFTENKERIFVRTRAVIGRKVQNCHPPQSVDMVEKILTAFKEGSRDSAEFWLTLKGRMLYIVFFAVRDERGKYLGTLEVTQDITKLRQLTGERKLLDEGGYS